jgi:hypothetical protein
VERSLWDQPAADGGGDVLGTLVVATLDQDVREVEQGDTELVETLHDSGANNLSCIRGDGPGNVAEKAYLLPGEGRAHLRSGTVVEIAVWAGYENELPVSGAVQVTVKPLDGSISFTINPSSLYKSVT